MEKIGSFNGKDVILVDEEAVCDCGAITHYRILDPSTMEWWVCCSTCLQGVMTEEERRRHAQQGMKNCLMVLVSFVLFILAILMLMALGYIHI